MRLFIEVVKSHNSLLKYNIKTLTWPASPDLNVLNVKLFGKN